MLNKFTLQPPTSSRPGVRLKMIDFNQFGDNRVPFEGGQFLVGPGATSKPDTHEVSECWMIARGKGILNYDGTDYEVEQGNCLFFEPHNTHYIHNPTDTELLIYTVWWMEK